MAAAAADEEGASQQCQVCRQQAAKYCCPRCQHRTCSLECVKAHKEASGCSGKRDRTAFVGRVDFDERTFLSDYRFLEEVQLVEDVAKRSKPPAPKLDMPKFLQTLVYQARRRGVQLHILPPGMEKRRTNSTRYDGRQQTLYWRVEWRFPAADVKTTDAKVHENTVVAELLHRHLALEPGGAARHHAVRDYSDAGLGALMVVMRKERTPANAVEYFKIDVSRPLRQQLAGKVVIEFPTLLVLLPREQGGYAIVPPAAAPEAAGTAAVASAEGGAPRGAGAAETAPAAAAAAAGAEASVTAPGEPQGSSLAPAAAGEAGEPARAPAAVAAAPEARPPSA